MTMEAPRTLRDIAVPHGFTAESLARLVGVDKATIYRHWWRDDWALKFKATSLHRLMGVLPGVDEAMTTSALAERRSRLVARAESAGHPLDIQTLDAAMETLEISPQYLYTAVDACLQVLTNRVSEAVALLRPLWGKPQSTALHVLFGTHPVASPLPDTQSLVHAARESFVEMAGMQGYTFSRVTAQSHLAHHVGKATGELLSETVDSERLSGLRAYKRGFYVRASHMGALRHQDDLELAYQYHHYVETDGIAKMLEAWSFPSWTGDIEATNDFAVPRAVSLTNTMEEIIAEIANYNDAYVWYLTTTFIPLAAAELDPALGGHRDALQVALTEKAECTGTSELQTACKRLLATLK